MKAQFVNEALGFTQDSDPIEDMGIGNSFKHLRVGNILRADGDIRITPRTAFAPSPYGRIISWANQYLVVLKTERTQLDKNKIKVWYVNQGDLANAKRIAKDLSGYMHAEGVFNSMTGTVKQYEKRFTIVQ